MVVANDWGLSRHSETLDPSSSFKQPGPERKICHCILKHRAPRGDWMKLEIGHGAQRVPFAVG